jgi:hypothetical protein
VTFGVELIELHHENQVINWAEREWISISALCDKYATDSQSLTNGCGDSRAEKKQGVNRAVRLLA